MKNIAMIPARMGSQRLSKKNLRELGGVSLIVRAIRKCQQADCFDEIWVNSENSEFEAIAIAEGVKFHKRPEALGDNQATSEQYITEFLGEHSCELLFQVHSIAPLLTVDDIRSFVNNMITCDADCQLSTEEIQIECAYNGEPINFTLDTKTNSQDLTPIQRVSWSITGWNQQTFLDAVRQGECATYAGNVEFYPISRLAAHVIKRRFQLGSATIAA